MNKLKIEPILQVSTATLVVLVAPGAVMMRRETRVHA